MCDDAHVSSANSPAEHPGVVEFWVDPVCPWCWVTARWMLERVQPATGVSVIWQPISLLFKNQPAPDSDYYPPVAATHRMLRVMEHVRSTDGDDATARLYHRLGSRIHHDRILDADSTAVNLGAELAAVGLDAAYAGSAGDDTLDVIIRERMQKGLDLVGTDVGTPIIALDGPDGSRVGVFGPVITRVPDIEASVELWRAMVTLARTDGFWELKRTRTQRPDFGERPDW